MRSEYHTNMRLSGMQGPGIELAIILTVPSRLSTISYGYTQGQGEPTASGQGSLNIL
jgi:hypothetical protein